MISDEEKHSILRDYTTGVITRSRAMKSLGFDWYGDLRQEVAASGLSIELPDDVLETMRRSADEVFDVLVRKPPREIG